MRSTALLLMFALLPPACSLGIDPSGGNSCEVDRHCFSSFRCARGMCVRDEEVGGEGEGEGEELTPAGWYEAIDHAHCALVQRCHLPQGSLWQDEADCRASFARSRLQGHYVTDAVADGQLVFDAARAATCLAELRDRACPELLEWFRLSWHWPVEDCDEALSGAVSEGEPCWLGFECQSGLQCHLGEGCPGRCQPPVARLGEECDSHRLCDFPDALCSDGRCVEYLDEQGESCEGSSVCAFPLQCSATDQTCQPYRLQDEECGANGPRCVPGLVCFTASPQGTGTCERPHAQDEGCTESAQCRIRTDTDTPRLVCRDGTCRPAPPLGQPCYEGACERAAWCDYSGDSPLCVALPGSGESCAAGRFCSSGLRCSDGTCRPLVGDDEACASYSECASGRCSAGHCVAPGEPPCPDAR